MSAERVLCACAFPVGAPEAAARLRDLHTKPVDWASIPSLLTRHGLIILAASHLQTVRDEIPDHVWHTIQTAALDARVAALALSAELRRILSAMIGAGIAVLPFKGPLLGLDVYGDLAARPFDDLDLLVRERDVDAAMESLRKLGYVSQHQFTPAQDRWFRRVDGDYPLVHASTGVLVELHERAMSKRFGPGLNTDDLWNRHCTTRVAEESVAVLNADDQLYLYMVHGTKHRWERLEWLASAAVLLNRRGGDATALLHAPYTDARAVLLGCQLAHDLLAAPLHAEMARAIAADSAVSVLAREARQHMFDNQTTADKTDTAEKLWFNYRIARGAVARARYVWRWMLWPSPEDWRAVAIPDALFPLYRVVRPARLGWRYLHAAPRTTDLSDA